MPTSACTPRMLDDESPDGELRRAIRALRARHPGRNLAGGPIHRRAHVRADRHADLEQRFASRRRWSTTCSATRRRPSKFSIGKYMQAGSTGFSESYNPLQLTTAAVAWTDANGDGVPQGELGCVYLTPGCEINLAQLPNGFGVASLANFDPDIKRMYNVETAVSVQHELLPRRFGAAAAGITATSTTCGAATTRCRHLRTTRRSRCTARSTARRSPTTTSAPRSASSDQLRGHAPPAATGRCGSTGSSTTSMRGLPHGITLFGGGMSERTIAQVCDEQSNPEPAALLRSDPERHPVPHAVQDRRQRCRSSAGSRSASRSRACPATGYGTGALSGREGGPTGPTGQPSATAAQHAERRRHGVADHADDHATRPARAPCVAQGKCTAGQLVDPGMNVTSLSVPLIAPNTEFGDRINQLDMNFSKTFKVQSA